MPLATRELQSEYQRAWIAKRRADFFEGKSCVECGAVEALELDHIDPSTKVSHRIWSWSKARRDEETAKCQILCNACHNAKSAAFFDTPPHGTNARYTSKKYKCRCGECRAAHAVANAKYRKGI